MDSDLTSKANLDRTPAKRMKERIKRGRQNKYFQNPKYRKNRWFLIGKIGESEKFRFKRSSPDLMTSIKVVLHTQVGNHPSETQVPQLPGSQRESFTFRSERGASKVAHSQDTCTVWPRSSVYDYPHAFKVFTARPFENKDSDITLHLSFGLLVGGRILCSIQYSRTSSQRVIQLSRSLS